MASGSGTGKGGKVTNKDRARGKREGKARAAAKKRDAYRKSQELNF